MAIKLNPGQFSVDIGTLQRLKLLTGLTGKTQAATLADILAAWLLENQEYIEDRLAETAAAYGLTPKECEDKLINGEDLGDLVTLVGISKKKKAIAP